MARKKQKAMSKRLKSLLEEFDNAAQNWGYQSDSGVGDNVNRALNRYQETLFALEKAIIDLEAKAISKVYLVECHSGAGEICASEKIAEREAKKLKHELGMRGCILTGTSFSERKIKRK